MVVAVASVVILGPVAFAGGVAGKQIFLWKFKISILKLILKF